jgi:Domain of unknown function (DUF4189)
MKTLALLNFLLGMLGVCGMAHSEGGTCPNGYYPANSPGVMGCAPIPGYNNQQQQAAPQPPPPQWADRWGAIASDVPRGAVGTAADMFSQQEAQLAAMTACQAKGGANCKLDTWYRNRCAAMVVDDGGYNVVNRDTLDEAIQASMKGCTDAGAMNCHVYYFACSLPVRVR